MISSTHSSQGKEGASWQPSPRRARRVLGEGRGAAVPAANDSCDSCCRTSSFTGSPALQGAHGGLRGCGLCSPQPSSPVHTGSLSLKQMRSFIWEGRSRRPLQPAAAEGQLAQQHQAQDLIWPGQEREAGQEAQGQSCSSWAKTQPPRLKAPDRLSWQFR